MNIKLAAENNRLREKQKGSKELLTSFQEGETAKKEVSRRSSKIVELAHRMDLSIKEARHKV